MLSNKLNHPQCGCKCNAHQFPIRSPQNRRSLTVSSRRSFPARDILKRGPTFPCGARYRRPRALRSAPAPIRRVPERTDMTPQLRRRRRLRSLRRRRVKAKEGKPAAVFRRAAEERAARRQGLGRRKGRRMKGGEGKSAGDI